MKKTISLSLLIIFSAFFLFGCAKKDQPKDTNINLEENIVPTSTTMTTISPTKTQTQDTFVAIKTKDGEIVLKLYQDLTPNTVANFVSKANSGFYKNLIFHRVIPGFMAQGGDPLGTGTGGGNQKSEINNIPFKRGSIGLARAGNIEVSNDSQFFICFSTQGCQHLTGDYVNFGEVVSGLDVLDKIVQGDKILDVVTTTK
ncbi:MAG: peptidylprolyl isomerase [Candidatus Shapirobacteria bacterium]|nr:peptidylprolyl isomerase [Candidatus Shapirobacteria bacterium]